nr:MAG TPA: hypothetical protein [Caudoviricetes sp.]
MPHIYIRLWYSDHTVHNILGTHSYALFFRTILLFVFCHSFSSFSSLSTFSGTQAALYPLVLVCSCFILCTNTSCCSLQSLL